jgi:N-acyl amino acid synthase of PEP-CTERM/exosortase system
MNSTFAAVKRLTLAQSANLSEETEGLLARHNRYFCSVTANTPELLEIAHALRYQVYCLERKFEDPNEHTDGLETDAFDAHALHGVLFHRPTDRPMGTVRMILPDNSSPDCLPIVSLLRRSGEDLSRILNISQCVEISRFAISKEFRRRQSDNLDAAELAALSRRQLIREGNLACLSLIQFLVRQSTERGIFYWAAVMEPKLLRMLANMGIYFTSVGSLVMHHGLRQPCYCHVPSMLESVAREHPDYWEVLTDGGRLARTLAERGSQSDAPVQPQFIWQ